MKKRSSIIIYLIAFPIAWLVGGVFALLVLGAVDNSIQLGPGTEVLIWIGAWIVSTLVLTVGIAAWVKRDSSKPQTPTERAAKAQVALERMENESSTADGPRVSSVVAFVAWLLVGAVVIYGWMAISFWSKQ